MSVVFAADTMRRALPRLLEATAQALLAEEFPGSGDVDVSAVHAALQHEQLCDVALDRLGAQGVEDRSAARSALRIIFLSEPALEPVGDLISNLLASWRSDLVSTLQATGDFANVRIEGCAVVATPTQESQRRARGVVEEVVRVEHEHSDWLVDLLITRAVAFRHDLNEVATGLWEFSQERAATVIRLEGHIGPDDFRVRLKRLSLKDELRFLNELQEAVKRDLKRLAQEPLTPEVAAVVQEQVFTPLRFPKHAETLSRIPIHSECLPCELPDAEQMSSAELVKDVRLRADAIMQSSALEARVFHERATSTRKRCIAVADVPPLGASRLLEFTRIISSLAEDINPIVKDEAIRERVLLQLTDCLRQRGLNDPTIFSSPMVLSSYIDPEETVGNVPYLVLLGIAPQSGEAPSEEAEDAESSADPDESDAGAVDEVSAGFLLSIPNDQPLSFQIALLRGAEKADLLLEAEKLMQWFSVFEATLRESANHEDNTSTYAASDTSIEEREWKYYGLSHSDCDELCRDFLEIVADSHPEVWELLPESARLAPTICDISIYSPLQQCFDVAACVNRMADNIEGLSADERENVRRWLVAFEDAESPGEKIPTVEFLLSIEHWKTAAECYLHPTDDLGEHSANELDEDFGVEDFIPAVLNDDMVGKRFYRAHEHLLMNSLTQQGRVTLRELLQTGHIFLEGVSTECIKCLNEVPARVLQREIATRAETESLGGRDARGSAWYESPHQQDYSTCLALSSTYSSMWAEVLEKYRNKRGS
jgi:hypothetical protein